MLQRWENLKKLIDSLCKNTEFKNSVVHFYCDGPKNKRPYHARLVLIFTDKKINLIFIFSKQKIWGYISILLMLYQIL